jgi:hypothetical protein
MRYLSFAKRSYPPKLSAELATLVPLQLRVPPGGIIVTAQGETVIGVADDLTPEEEAAIRVAVEAHDPTPPPDPLVVALSTARAEAGANPLDGITVREAMTWIDNNVTSLAQAREALKLAVKIIAIQERRLRLIEKQLGL